MFSFPIVSRKKRDLVVSGRPLAAALLAFTAAAVVATSVFTWQLGVDARSADANFDVSSIYGWFISGLSVLLAVFYVVFKQRYSHLLIVAVLFATISVSGVRPVWLMLIGYALVASGWLVVAQAYVAMRHREALQGVLSDGGEVGTYEPFNPRELVKPLGVPKAMFVCAVAALACIGFTTGAVMNSAVPVGAPSFPNDGVIHAGGEAKPEVQILYSVNSPNAAVLFGDDSSVLKKLVEDGKISLTVQGTAPGDQIDVAGPALAGEACAYDLGGESGWLSYLSSYNRSLKTATVDADVSELVHQSGDQIDGFSSCFNSGKYEYGVRKYLVNSQDLVVFPYAKVFINGEEKQPADIDDLQQMIEDASK